MPELPDVTIYCEALERRIAGHTLERVRIASPFVLRTAVPPIRDAESREVLGVRRAGKRVVLALDDDLFLVIHLMIAGRLHWVSRGSRLPGKIGLAAFDFDCGTLTFTEASPKKRASLHLVRGPSELAQFEAGGIEPLDADLAAFRDALTRENHTVKRALTDPHLLSGIGNAYSDEILHAARLSPMKQTGDLSEEEFARLHRATHETLAAWIARLRDETGDGFPENVTAFRSGMSVHGRFRRPCPVCGAPVQRIRYADNECNYCPSCQTGGRILADRSLSRLFKGDWPRTLDELERLRQTSKRAETGG